MDAFELLRKWPTWEKANAATVLASPAWRMPVKFDGRDAKLRIDASPEPSDAVRLRVMFDGEHHVLDIFDSEAFPDLHMLWSKRDALPQEIVLALVEKECGPLLQLMEDVTRKQLSVDGLGSDNPAWPSKTFVLEDGGSRISFALDLSPTMEIMLGRLDLLDPAHESIRSLERSAEAEYAAVSLSDEDFASLAPGDFVLLPDGAEPRWTVEKPLDGQVHVLGPEVASLTFAQMADDALPPVPESGAFSLVRFGEKFATGTRSQVGDRPAVKIVEKN